MTIWQDIFTGNSVSRKHRQERCDKWYEHEPSGVVEDDAIKLLWDFMIQCDSYVECRKPDIMVVDKKEKKCLIIDTAIIKKRKERRGKD